MRKIANHWVNLVFISLHLGAVHMLITDGNWAPDKAMASASVSD